MSAPTRKRPALTGRGNASIGLRSLHALYGTRASTSLPRDWRERVTAHAGDYYRTHVENLTKANLSGWAQCRCPFHEDGQASLSVNPITGRWRCFAGCGSGDVVSFHMRVTGLGFKQAVRDLLGLRP